MNTYEKYQNDEVMSPVSPTRTKSKISTNDSCKLAYSLLAETNETAVYFLDAKDLLQMPERMQKAIVRLGR